MSARDKAAAPRVPTWESNVCRAQRPSGIQTHTIKVVAFVGQPADA